MAVVQTRAHRNAAVRFRCERMGARAEGVHSAVVHGGRLGTRPGRGCESV